MTETKTKTEILDQKEWLADHLLILAFLLGLNLAMSLLVRQVGVFVINRDIFYLEVDLWLVVLAVITSTFFSFYLKLAHSYPVAVVLIISGIWSNLVERLIFGGVADYLNIYIALTNLADLQIWLGLIGLNFQIWFPQAADRLGSYLNSFKKNEEI
jgi:lipoprotein signal peptidase